MTVVAHWPGAQVTWGRVSRQRCLWCGELIEHKDWDKITLPDMPGMTTDEVETVLFKQIWENTWVEIRDGVKQAVDSELEAPENACVRITEEN